MYRNKTSLSQGVRDEELCNLLEHLDCSGLEIVRGWYI
jgi:hypothetical protein